MKSYQFWLLAVFILLTSCSSMSTSDDNKKRGEIFLNAGISSLWEGRYTEALASFLEASKFLPNDSGLWNNLALAYAGKDEAERAESAWKKSLDLDPRNTDSRLNMGAMLLQKRRFREAERELKLALEDLTYAKSYLVNFNLALLYLEEKKPLMAEQQFELTVRNNPNHCPAWYQLGLLQKEKGETELAIKSMKNSVQGQCFRNPEIHYEIGSLLLKDKDKTAGKAKLVEIIQLFPQSEWAKKAELTLNIIR